MKKDKLNYDPPVIISMEVWLEQVIATSNEITMEDTGIAQETWMEENISTGDIELQ